MVVPNETGSTFSTSYMVKKLVNTIVHMAFNLQEALKFTWEMDFSKCIACGLL